MAAPVRTSASNPPSVLDMDVSLSPQAVEVDSRQPYKLWIRFDDGLSGVVELAQWSTRADFAA